MNSLMHVCSHNSTLETYDPQLAVNHWNRMVHRRPGVRNRKAPTSSEEDSSSELSDTSDSDIQFLSEHDD